MTASGGPSPAEGAAGAASSDVGSEIEIVADVRTATAQGVEGGIRLPPGMAADLRELVGK